MILQKEIAQLVIHLHVAENGKVLFTDFTYDNIGVPKNPANPLYKIPAAFNPKASNTLDYGLGGILNEANFQRSL